MTEVTQFDFRFLLPVISKDINDNSSEVSFDIFGLVTGTALKGKGLEADDLTGFQPDLTQAQIDGFLANPAASGAALLSNATSRFVYSFAALPAVVGSITRETHAAVASAAGVPSKLQFAFEYSDGMGQIAMKKIQTEPDRARQVVVHPDGTCTVTPVDTSPGLRWIGAGRTIVNNKGNPVLQFEPYFSATPAYETAQELVESGVSPLSHYDSLNRFVRHPHLRHVSDGSNVAAIFSASIP